MRKTFTIACCASILIIGCSHPAAGDEGEQPRATPTAQSIGPRRPETLCRPKETVIYSCRIRSNGKLASLCAPPDFATSPEAGVYYVFGKPGAIEMRYPHNTSTAPPHFMQAHLVFAGATGGYAYSFVNRGFKYLLYSISGTGIEDQGVIVAKIGARQPVVEMPCAPGSMVEPDLRVFDAAGSWPEDGDVGDHGLPRF